MKNKKSKLDHLNFTVANLNQSIDWYNKVFNFKVVEESTDSDGNSWAIIKSGDSMLALTEHSDKTVYKGNDYHKFHHFGLRLVDIEEWEETIKRNSLKTQYSSPVQYKNSTSWYVLDPTGHEIEVSIWKNNKVKFEAEGE